MRYLLTILAFALIVTAQSQITTLGVQASYTDSPGAGLTITMTPNNFGLYTAARINGTDATALGGLTYRMPKYKQLIYLAASAILFDENPNRVGFGAEFGVLFYPHKNFYYHFGAGTNEFKTTNIIFGIGVKM